MKPYYEDERLTLIHGDASEQVRTLDAGSVQTVVTSPPYFKLRDYGEDGQYGAEATVGEFVERLVALFREIRRVLADDGTVWLNLGDSYASGGMSNPSSKSTLGGGKDRGAGNYSITRRTLDAPPKNLLGIPWRVALALQADGWILRSDIIWRKPNAMPESVTDRPTKAHEYLFLLTKSPRYYYDAAAIKVPAVKGAAGSRFDTGKTASHMLGRASTAARADDGLVNIRTVWSVPTIPFRGAHFAVYPPELIRPCIRAGSAPGDVVLDPFSGSGTTGMVALQEGRKYVGIDLNSDYLDLSLRTRFQLPPLDEADE